MTRQAAASADQAALFDTPAPEVRRAAGDPHVFLPTLPRDTQVAAAAAALPKSGTQRRRVLDAIAAAGPAGMTDQEIAAALGLAENSVRPRRKELEEQGLITDSDERRETSTGNRAIVWIASVRESSTIHAASQ